MPQDSLDRIREALTRLPTCNRAELTAEWLRLYRTKPPAQIGRNLLMASVASLAGTDSGRIATRAAAPAARHRRAGTPRR